jgi:predicted enzyme related to lactoylglutathione lyase
MPRVNYFEIPADNPDRATKFYSEVFNWKIEKWAGPMDYWLVTTGTEPEPGIDGGIAKRSDLNAVTNTIGVTSLDEAMDKVVAAGGKVVKPKTTIPGFGYMAYCLDTEGNTFGIMESAPNAK